MNNNVGKVVQVIGPVVDIKFNSNELPNLLNAIEIELNKQMKRLILPMKWKKNYTV